MSLVTTVEEAKKHLRVAGNYDVKGLPNFDAATAEMLIPVLGDTLYDDLLSKYEGENGTDIEKRLITLCQAVIVPVAFQKELLYKHITISDTGAKVSESDDTRTMYKWEYKELSQNLLNDGYGAQEILLSYLISNTNALNWGDSPYNDATGFAIIRSGSELKKCLHIEQPHRCYLQLKPVFNDIGETELITKLGEDFYRALHGQIVAGTLSTKGKYLVSFLQKACSHLAVAIAASDMGIRFTVNGFTIIHKITDATDEGEGTPEHKRMLSFIENRKRYAMKFFEMAMSYLNNNASDNEFAEYYNSELYTAPGTDNSLDSTGMKNFYMS